MHGSLQSSTTTATYADDGGMAFAAIVLSVFPHDISRTDADRITKPDVEMFQDESWKPIYAYFGVKRSKVKVPSHKKCQQTSIPS